MDWLRVILVGGAFGGLCALFRLPIPAPPTWVGVMGIAAVVGGWKLMRHFLGG